MPVDTISVPPTLMLLFDGFSDDLIEALRDVQCVAPAPKSQP